MVSDATATHVVELTPGIHPLILRIVLLCPKSTVSEPRCFSHLGERLSAQPNGV